MAKQTIPVTRHDVEALATRLERRSIITANLKDRADLRLAATTLRQLLRHGLVEDAFAIEVEE